MNLALRLQNEKAHGTLGSPLVQNTGTTSKSMVKMYDFLWLLGISIYFAFYYHRYAQRKLEVDLKDAKHP